MNSTIEYSEESPPPVSEVEDGTSDDSVNLMATIRAEVYPPSCIVKRTPSPEVTAKTSYIHACGDREFWNKLTRAGVPAGAAQLFIQLLWKAAAELNWPVSVNELATAVGRYPAAVSRGLKVIQDAGMVEVALPRTYPASWRFPVYEVLMECARNRFGNKVQEKIDDSLPGKDP